MSADNGVYIVKFPDGYRVAHTQAIENIDWHRKGTKARKKMLKAYFGHSPVFETLEEAERIAHKIEDQILADDFCPICEYGVVYLGEYEAWA